MGWMRDRIPSKGRLTVGPRLVALVAVAALALAACGSNVPTVRPSGSQAASPSSSGGRASDQSSEPALVACRNTDLKAAIVGWQAASGSRFAALTITRRSGAACTVRGTPGVRLLDSKGKIVLDSAKIAGIGGPKIKAADPLVVVRPGDELELDVQWTNWCKAQPKRPLTVALVLTSGGGLLKATKAARSGTDTAPTCTSKSRPSQLRVAHAWLGPGV
jgi:hypothetical protein